MGTSLTDICTLFDRYGYKYHQQDEQTLLVGIRGTHADFTLGARLDQSWLTLSIVRSFSHIPTEWREKVYAYLLQLNYQITFARFAVESNGDIALLADLPAQDPPDYALFAMAVDLLTFYANDSYRHLYQIITGEELREDDRDKREHVG